VSTGTTTATAPTDTAPAPPVAPSVRTGATSAVAGLATALGDSDVEQLCQPGAIFTPAVVAAMNAGGQTCEAGLEVSSVLASPPTLAVTGLTAKPGLATAQVKIPDGSTIPIDLVPDGRRWLVSFSNGADPLSVLEQH
jgi:hypothetical protein